MEVKWLWVVTLALLLSGNCFECGDACWEEDKIALFQLKPFFNHIEDVHHWPEPVTMEVMKSTSDCCDWERVECNPVTGRVTALFLNQSTRSITDGDLTTYEYSDDYYYNSYPKLNTSLFVPFVELKTLYLSGNHFDDCVPDEGFQKLSFSLDKLEILDLSDNNFNESILLSLSKLSSLKSLYLGFNYIGGSNATYGAIKMLSKALNKLETLDLSHNGMLGNDIISHLGSFTSLKSLSLIDCGLNGTIDIQEFNNLTSLKELYLGYNRIESFRSLQESEGTFGLMNSLEVLDLSDNKLNNSILSSVAAFSNLKSLYLSYNNFSERTIDIKELNDLHNLEELRIGCASSCSIQLGSGLFPSIKSLYLEGFDFDAKVTAVEEWQNWSNLKELTIIESSIHSKFLQGIDTLTSLEKFTLYLCHIHGNMSLSELQNLTHLQDLRFDYSYLPSNFLRGIGTLRSLKSVYIYITLENDVSIYSNEWQNLTNLEVLDIYVPSLPSDFIQCIGTLTSLRIMRLVVGSFFSINGPLQLKNLESMDLEGVLLQNNFLRTAGAMPSLKHLNLRNSGLSGTLPLSLCESKHLEYLDISGNYNLTGGLPECFSNFTSLRYLHLSSNQFSGNISCLESLTSLAYLHLSSNRFSGNISCLESLTSLKYLDLSSNRFSGKISCLESLTSLTYLDLSSNRFSGNISSLKSLTSLGELRLSSNNFEIPSSLAPLYNLSSLKVFYADNNTIYPENQTHSSSPATFQLTVINMPCCGDGGAFPKFLYHQHSLERVDLSNIFFKGEFPNWLLENNTHLQSLLLVNNSLSGPFKPPLLPQLDYLDVSNNSLSGKIAKEIGVHLPSLQLLNMSNNHFNGSIPASFGDTTALEALDLSNNQFSGGIPEGFSSLRFLALSNNSLQGPMFSANFSSINLEMLYLDGNNFFGSIPDSLSQSSSLRTLEVSNNQLSGRIPGWMGNMQHLEEILMSGNHIQGPIPREFCKLNHQLKILDLSMNNISGTLPSCFKPSTIRQVYLSNNKLQGPLPVGFRDSSSLVTLDLSYNSFTGNIPNWIGRLSQLSYVLLNRNHFEGEIPIQLCKLSHLSLIDFSHNNLSGRIPSCLKISAMNHISTQYVQRMEMHKIIYSPKFYRGIEHNISIIIEKSIKYTMKGRSYSYKGRILGYLSGIDLSCNRLTGEILHETENFRMVKALNFSHNSLTGPIPEALSKLGPIESLDLSFNNLSGNIPSELVELNFLASFNVSYNNLSGRTPQMVQQFATFEESSYLENPFLCGAPLPNNCSATEPPVSTPMLKVDDGWIDMSFFYVSFFASYAVVLLATALVLYINPYWRRAWFYHVERIATSCYYFVVDHLPAGIF